MPKIHELKTHPSYFKSVKDGRKNFECRKDDRDYKVGDEILLKEWKPIKGEYPGSGASGGFTGSICHRRITYVLRDFEGLKPGFVIIGIEKI